MERTVVNFEESEYDSAHQAGTGANDSTYMDVASVKGGHMKDAGANDSTYMDVASVNGGQKTGDYDSLSGFRPEQKVVH